MTQPTMKDARLSDLVSAICDRGNDVADLTRLLIEHWSYDLYARRPGPALLDDNTIKQSDLDLACFVSALAARRAVINLPEYRARRPVVQKPDEHVVSKENRHGQILGLTSNKETFSFGIRIKDMNVITTNGDQQDVGAYRTFLITDLDGTFYDGWDHVEFVPTAKENAWLLDKQLWTDEQLVFEHFVHPNRWTSFYGKYYLATKVLIARLEAEGAALRRWIKERADEEAVLADGPVPTPAPPRENVPTKEVVIEAFEAVVDAPEMTGKFIKPESLDDAGDRLSEISAALSPLRFATRATELAFYRHGPDPRPAWVGGVWTPYTVPRSPVVWNSISLVFKNSKHDVILRYRTRERREHVAA